MTQEEKARAYDETLERAKTILKRGYYISGDIEVIFPELAESKDEKIKKDIISYLQRKQNKGELDVLDWIAYLEKQGASINVDSILNKVGIKPAYKDGNAWCILYGDNLQDGICDFGDTKEDALVAFIKELLEKQGESYTKKDVDDAYLEGMVCAKNELEKQGEQKPNPYTGTSFEYNGHTFGMCARDNGVEILFDGELKAFLSSEKSFIYPIHPQPSLIPKAAQETTNKTKVEPKFKVGDFILNDYCMGKVIEVTNDAYLLDSGQGIPFSCEHNAHLWTIQDAKDGDVLIGKIDGDEYITLFKRIKDGWLETYGYYYYAFDRFCPTQLFCREGEGTLFPATREQRDQLERAMTNAGYEWDAEKKELKLLITNGGDFESMPTDEEVQKLHDHLEMHKELGDIPKVVTFTNSDNERIIEKLNEVIGKLGDIHQVLSGPFVFPYRDYTPPQEAWYKKYGIERIGPVTCETLNSIETDNGKDNDKEIEL